MKETTIFLGLIIPTTMMTTVESGLQNFQLLNSLLRFCADSGGFFKIGNQNNLATLPGFASVLINGYTYSYVYKDPRNGEKCCRPIKSKCEWEEIIVQNLFTKKMPKRRDTCKITRGEILCGKRCTRIKKALEKLQREVEGREKEENERTEEGKEEEKESKEALKPHSSEDERKEKDKQSNENEKEREEKDRKEKEGREKERERKEKEGQRDYVEIHAEAAPGGAKGLEVKKGQKLSQRQLQMIETAAEEKETQSRNPLCREEKGFLPFYLPPVSAL